MIWESCRDYFLASRNPFDLWFGPVERLLSATGASYYENGRDACHLDLVPYATRCKWAHLAPANRSSLLSTAGKTLGELLRHSPIELLVLNGRSVVCNFQRLAGVNLNEEALDAWTIRRRSGRDVPGFSCSGVVNALCGIPLDKNLVVIGFNHNIQGSHGLTGEIRCSIRDWIGTTSQHSFQNQS